MGMSKFSGLRNANEYYYGGPSGTPGALVIAQGNSATGSQTITLEFGQVVLADGSSVAVVSTTTPILVGNGANQETVTPTAVSNLTPGVYGTCQVTASFANTHGTGEQVASATFGLVEAVNDAHGKGGVVAVDGTWTGNGGVTATITGNKGWTNVCVLDWRGTTGAVSYKAASNGANMAATTNVLY